MQYENFADPYPNLNISPMKQFVTTFLKKKSRLSHLLKQLKVSFRANEKGVLPMEYPE